MGGRGLAVAGCLDGAAAVADGRSDKRVPMSMLNCGERISGAKRNREEDASRRLLPLFFVFLWFGGLFYGLWGEEAMSDN